jgi:GNAT superfamily N-acetyltransferase
MPKNSTAVSEVPYVIRPCVVDDAQTLVDLVGELALYEQLQTFARATPESYRAHLFGPRRVAEAILAEVGGAPVGFAIYYMTFSTFRGYPGVYVEDLYVRPEYRGRGIGKALMATVARAGADRGCCRLEWSVLNWNAPAVGFYEALGARPMDAWTVYRLDGESLDRLTGSDSPAPSTPEPETTAG